MGKARSKTKVLKNISTNYKETTPIGSPAFIGRDLDTGRRLETAEAKAERIAAFLML